MTKTDLPTSIRRLDGPEAERLARLVAAYDELQTVLRACERLVELFEAQQRDDVEVEALWTLALLSYARIFGADAGDPALTEDELIESVATSAAGGGKDGATDGGKDAGKAAPEVDREKVREWHRVMMHLRDHHADPHANPRESYTAGVALDADGAVNAVAVTSVRSPTVDEAAVRQAGAIAYPLIALLDQRIDPLQQQVFEHVRTLPKEELAGLEEIEVAQPD